MSAARADALVLFGATGDLARKQLLPSLYRLAARGQLDCPVVGVAATAWNDDELRDHARAAVAEAVGGADEGALTAFLGRLVMVAGDYQDAETFRALASRLGEAGAEHPVHYLAIPPGLFDTVVDGLAGVGLHRGARVVVEKPFGRDLASARALNEVLHRAFPESAVFRIDHYLGKEAVENVLVYRFGNTLLEPVWNRRYVSSIQVTMAEDFGVEGRGGFYDSVGAVRDVVQNHLLQVVALLAMEPPVSDDPDALRDEKVKVFRAMRRADPADLVRGQYEGYLDEPGVAAGSSAETFVALRLHVDSWRWAGVPFLVRAGKALPVTALEAVVEFQAPPRLLFSPDGCQPHPNHLRFRLGRNDGVTLRMEAKEPGEHLMSQGVDLSMDFRHVLGARRGAYERLLDDSLDGNPVRFARQDGVEAAWRVVQPLIDGPGPVHSYPRGSWGPRAADAIADVAGGWHAPDVPAQVER
jgi:glucose-6-phosphate 1-dehydrogenase